MKSVLIASLAVLVIGRAEAADKIDFTSQIQPILKSHCYRCHGARADKGGLRLNSSEALLEYVVIPGDLESELYLRLVEEDEELRMPKSAEPLSPELVELVKLWIEQGAKMPEGLHVEVVAETVVEDSAAATPDALEALKSTGALVLPIARGYNLLTVNFATCEADVNDELISPLVGVREQVAYLNLAGSNVSDAGLAIVGQLKKVSRLQLENTSVTDAGLAHLSSLMKLEYLNLYGTSITDAGLEHLQSLSQLKKLYLWKTKVNYEPAMQLQASIDGLEVNLGWDHPELRRTRLKKVIKTAKDQKEEAAAREAAAKLQKEAAAQREAEAQKELDELEHVLSTGESGGEELTDESSTKDNGEQRETKQENADGAEVK